MSTRKPSEPPPRTKISGEYSAVKNFYKELEIYNTETAPAMDKQVERLDEIIKKTIQPKVESSPEIVIPKLRSPSFVDEDELTPTTPKDLGDFDGNKDADKKP